MTIPNTPTYHRSHTPTARRCQRIPLRQILDLVALIRTNNGRIQGGLTSPKPAGDLVSKFRLPNHVGFTPRVYIVGPIFHVYHVFSTLLTICCSLLVIMRMRDILNTPPGDSPVRVGAWHTGCRGANAPGLGVDFRSE